MAAQIEALMRQNTELLLRAPEPSHHEETRGRREEEEHNSQVNAHSQPGRGHQEDNFREHVNREEDNRVKDNQSGGTWDTSDKEGNNKEFNWRMAKFDKRCTNMEMERKDISIEKLLQGIGSHFSQHMEEYRLPKKFKFLI